MIIAWQKSQKMGSRRISASNWMVSKTLMQKLNINVTGEMDKVQVYGPIRR